jgi:hypothetical protein
MLDYGAMPRLPLTVLLCLSLLAMRVSGVHLHACFGMEAPGSHPSVHLADGGMFFGEHHAEDDGDDLELDLPDQRSAKIDYPPSLDVAPRSQGEGLVVVAERVLELPWARGPPPPQSASYYKLTPPAQAPPALS